MTLTMQKTQAWELLHDSEHCSRLSMEELHKLMLRAGYSEEEASGAAKQRGWDRLSAGDVM